MEELTERQRQILEFIIAEVQQKGYPPSVREIGEAVGLSSSSTVHAHLAKLEELGYLRRDPTKPRALEVLIGNNYDDQIQFTKEMVNIPLVGTVTAGEPILASENIQDYFPLPRDFTRTDSAFMLRIKGDSMINAGIFDGDLVIVSGETKAVNNGDIVVAMIEDEATVKRFYKEKNGVRLQPENDRYEPIITSEVQILGKVVGLVRKIH
ncbi:MAG TPA: transcriptional repressor LexA [Bacillota bacterium]|jgi:repressor LexA|nr:transcriptional repressor LexA [Bacillota bacterium]HOL10610.1 transcriptional repressor LexA [Bacillota bacterium]HPO98585.1 transcriptional repressor LexA [Bacillota bacterium]